MVCTCCSCKDCSDIVGGAILYIDSNYELKLNPGLVTGTPMNTITPVIGAPYSVGPGCTPATYQKTSSCVTAYNFVTALKNGYVGETIITNPAQPLTVLASGYGQASPLGGTKFLFYTGGTGATDQYIDYSNPTWPLRTNINWGATTLEYIPEDPRDRRSKHEWILSSRCVHAIKVLVNPPPPLPGFTKAMTPTGAGSVYLAVDSARNNEMTSPQTLGLTINEPVNATQVTGHGFLYCKRVGGIAPTVDGDYLQINYNQSCLGFCDGAMATTVNGQNEASFQAKDYVYGQFFEGYLRRLAIFPSILSLTDICTVFNCWAQI